MSNTYDIVLSLTSEKHKDSDRLLMLRDFANDMGWRPSYYLIEPPLTSQFAHAHLVVEHGLQPAAVITFLDQSHSLEDIQLSDLNKLMEISYNNLVDWHLYVEPGEITFCYNRKKPLYIETRRISRSDIGSLRNEAFDQVVGRKPTPNLPTLDQALIETISSWRRVLSAELKYAVPTINLSALFNSILFVRTIEDQNRRTEPNPRFMLLDQWARAKELNPSLKTIILSAMRKMIGTDIPKFLIDEEKLAAFDSLDASTVHAFLADFYNNKFAPYSYDFSVMSKHALSRIYEHYTALLHVEESAQMAFIPRLPEEEWNKQHGSVYTPQFIARFFARFLKNQLPPKLFRQISTIDPACGSGIFLRTLLELQCDPLQDNVTSDSIKQVFNNTYGWDIDDNAANATTYSLTSLYLVLLNSLPQQLNIKTVESIGYYQERPELKESFDTVISNPPFVSLGTQSDEFRERISLFMGDESKGRTDIYLAFLKMGMELIKPGGYGLFVLPHSFLLTDSASSLRKRLNEEFWIHCLADLSAIRVFEDLGSYIVLIIFQKKASFVPAKSSATIVKCQDYVGMALEDTLDGRSAETPSYSVYEVTQKEFERDNWVILPPKETIIRERLESLPRLGELTEIREGLITGSDNIFILDKILVPKGEEVIYKPFLPDRKMQRYNVPLETEKQVLYPFVESRKLSQVELEQQFPKTWEYLCLNREILENRLPVRRGTLKWWEPVRPRSPELLFRPKIISPHLMMVPRFSLDEDGKYAISRACYLYSKISENSGDLLRFLVAILNSPVCHWYISLHSHKYSHGYTMLEPKTLKTVPIPNPKDIPGAILDNLLSLVDQRLRNPTDLSLENEIDNITSLLYGLSIEDQESIGVR